MCTHAKRLVCFDSKAAPRENGGGVRVSGWQCTMMEWCGLHPRLLCFQPRDRKTVHSTAELNGVPVASDLQSILFCSGHAHLLLLGYLSGVKPLPSITSDVKSTEECKQRLHDIANSPWKLMALCRGAIRRHLGYTCPYAITVLPLPTALKKYLRLEDLRWCLSCNQCAENSFVVEFSG